MDAAAAAFMETGFAGARVDQIARRAGVNKAMIYYHFRSKRGLYQAVLLRLFRDVLEGVGRLARDEADPRRRLIAFYAGVARVFAERRALPLVMLREVLSGGQGMAPETARVLAGILAFVRDAVAEGARDGSLRPVNPLVVHLSALAPLILFFASEPFRDRLLPSPVTGVAMPTAEELLDHVALLIERGLEPAGGEPARPPRRGVEP